VALQRKEIGARLLDVRKFGARWVCLFSAALLWGQFPSPIPRIPFPRRGGQGKQTPSDRKAPAKKEPIRFNGVVRARAAESISVETDDTRIVEFLCSKDTKYLRNGEAMQGAVLKPGDEVSVDAWRDEEGFFHAISVSLRKQAPAPAPPAPPALEAEPSATVLAPPPAIPDPDDTGPPALRRGKPAPRATKTPAEEPSSPAPAPPKADPFLDQVRQTALEFTESLPNYLCKQVTARYQSERRPPSWQALDIVSAAVVYEDGRESYHDIRINDKPAKKAMDAIPGSRSRGEFGTTLRDLFSPATAAAFRYRRQSTAAGLPASVYDFQVERAHSHWENRVGGQLVFPAYRGSVWIDKQTRRVLRIEMQARNIPQEFPLDAVEWVVDYEFVRIGPGRYLVPIHAENLACFRGGSQCVRNTTDFRNYRKFTSESQIMTIDSTVSFEEEEDQPKPPGKKAEKKR